MRCKTELVRDPIGGGASAAAVIGVLTQHGFREKSLDSVDGSSERIAQSPITTELEPAVILPPCSVESPSLAAFWPLMTTVAEPLVILSGGPQHRQADEFVAAGSPSISTSDEPCRMGPPTCGTRPVHRGHTWRSVTRAAGFMSHRASYFAAEGRQCLRVVLTRLAEARQGCSGTPFSH